jgi:hypothetical protein
MYIICIDITQGYKMIDTKDLIFKDCITDTIKTHSEIMDEWKNNENNIGFFDYLDINYYLEA